MLCCWCLDRNKQWGNVLAGILGDGGDRIGCKWYQHVLLEGGVEEPAVRWADGRDAILICRDGEVRQEVANE